MNDVTTTRGTLSGLTIFRFVHAFASGGGMERIMEDLDQILLSRNAMTIIRMYIASSTSEHERVELRGQGRLILIPLPLPEGESTQIASDQNEKESPLIRAFRDRVLYHPLIWSLGFKQFLLHRRLPRRKGQVVGAGARFSELCRAHKIDLCMMHFFGGSDADEVMEAARSQQIPVALENHFANDRFMHLSIRKHVLLADGISGMNGLDVPAYLQKRFVNLADGIDTTCFDRRNASPPPSAPKCPIIFLPARIVRPKGQLDLVRAAARLRSRGLDFQLAFAGRVESTSFLNELKLEITRHGLTDRIRFLGVLGPEALRDWYSVSTVMAFPTYHHEGLGRIIVEAQAMQVPVVAYATGGVSEGVINGKTGFLVTTGDIETFTNKIELLLRDPERCQQMGAAGRGFVVDRYSLDALADRHERFYTQIIASRSQAAGERA